MSSIAFNNIYSGLQDAGNSIDSQRTLLTSTLDKARKFAFKFTSQFEGGKTDSLQTLDSGIISYGEHQATLRSGALEKVLNDYISRSATNTAIKLGSFMERVKAKDMSLRRDSDFLFLLKEAALEPAMKDSQEKVFISQYWLPAIKIAAHNGIRSDIGLAIFYDTNIQGGLQKVIEKVNKRIKTNLIDERGYLEIFLEERKEYLIHIARQKLKDKDSATASMLINSAEKRIGMLRKLLDQH